MAEQHPPPPSEMVQVGMILAALAPVMGAILSAPIVGGGLASLAVIDTVLMLVGMAR